MNETRLKVLVLKKLRERAIPCWKAGAGAFNPAGIPDIIGVLPISGRMIAIELKSPEEGYTFDNDEEHEYGKSARCKNCGCTPLQIARIEEFAAAGALAFAADSWARIEAKLIEAKRVSR